jgi:hypothetical protein
MSTYDKDKIEKYSGYVSARVPRYRRCPCELEDYCRAALKTDDLLACELGDRSAGIPLVRVVPSKNERGIDPLYDEWPVRGSVPAGEGAR